MDQLEDQNSPNCLPPKIMLDVLLLGEFSEEILQVSIDENIPLNIFIEFCISQSSMEIQQNESIIDISSGRNLYRDTDNRSLLEIGIRNKDSIKIKIKKKQNIKQQFKIFEEIKTEEQLINNYQNILFKNLDEQEQNFIIHQEQGILIQNFSNPLKNMKFQNDQTFLQKKQHLINNAFQQNLKQNQQDNYLTDPLHQNNQELINNNKKFNLDLLLYVLANQLKNSGQKLYQTKKANQLNILSLQASFAYGLQNSSCHQVTIKNTEEINYQQLQDEYKLKSFQNSIKQEIAKQFRISPKDINLLQIVEGSIKLFFLITNEAGVREEIEWKDSINEFDRIYHYSELVLHTYFQAIQLSADDFDPKYNFEWDQNHIQFKLRGPKQDQMKYFFPRGWKGYALKVIGKYDQGNDDWLKMDSNPNQWHIMYHGTKQSIYDKDRKKQSCVKGILEQGLRPGQKQHYEDVIDIRLKQKIGSGVYFSNHIEVAELYADPISIGDYNYRVVFQSRVRPQALKQIQNKLQIRAKQGNPDWDNDYFVVNKPEDIRPYRILLKKQKLVQQNQSDKSGGLCKIF